MKAKEIFRVKKTHGTGIVEIVIWQVPEPVPPSEHPYKYRLVYVIEGKRVVGYDTNAARVTTNILAVGKKLTAS